MDKQCGSCPWCGSPVFYVGAPSYSCDCREQVRSTLQAVRSLAEAMTENLLRPEPYRENWEPGDDR